MNFQKMCDKTYLVSLLVIVSLLACKKESYSPSQSAQPPRAPVLYYPSEIVAEPRRGLRVHFSFQGGNADGFLLQRTDPNGIFVDYANLGPSTNSEYDGYYEDWNVQLAKYYAYRLRAFNRDGHSDWSATRGKDAPGVQTRELLPAEASADAFVDQGRPTMNFGTDGYLLVTDSSSEYGMQRMAYVKFTMNAIPTYAVGIRSAIIRFFSQNEPSNGPIVHLFQVLADWTEPSIIWNNKPTRSFGALDLNQRVRNDGTPQYWDITQAAREWFDGRSPNYGIVIESASPTRQAVLYSRERESSIRPIMTLVYEW